MTSNIPVALHSQPEPGPTPSAVEDPIPPAGPRRVAPRPDRPGVWLHVASAGLLVLAAAAAAVSFTAQYRLVYAARHLATAAGLEAAIPDAAALVFACLGIALALHGRRAVRARALNISSAGASVFMNVIAAAPGWRDVAVWAMPPAAYALASDTLIGVIRSSVLARQQGPAAPPVRSPSGRPDRAAAVAAAVGMAPMSTLAGSAPGCSRSARSPPAAAPPLGARLLVLRRVPGQPRAPLRFLRPSLPRE